MNRNKLTLLACPSLLALILLPPSPTHAREIVAQPTNNVASVATQPVKEIVFERPALDVSQPQVATQPLEEIADNYDCGCSSEPATLDFTNEESQAAIDRYGCDCAGCISAVRQLQGKLPLL